MSAPSEETTRGRHWTENALVYAGHGWQVVPFHQRNGSAGCSCRQKHCSKPGRHPRFELFTQEASSNETDIRAWGNLWTHSGVGVVLGFASNLVVLEIDAGKAGVETFENLNVLPPDTLCTEEGGRVRRLFYQHPGAELPPKIELGPGLTLLADGAALRLPDAPFFTSKAPYRWTTGMADDPAPLPVGFWEAIGVQIHRDWPRLDAPPRVSLPFRRLQADMLPRLAMPDWMVSPWLARGALALLTGARGVGKSSFLIHLAVALLKGDTFAGARCRQTGVLYLTEQSPSTFARALLRSGADEAALRRLSVLYADDLRPASWRDLMTGCVDRAAKQGATLLVIDSLNTFAALADPPLELTSTALLEPLKLALACNLCVACTCSPIHPKASLAETACTLGSLGTAADILMSLENQGHHCRFLLRALSKFEDTPHVQALDLTENRLQPLPPPSATVFPLSPEPRG